MASFVVKAPPPAEGLAEDAPLSFDEKTMWRGNRVQAGDEVFLFAAEHHGGRGLYARGVAVAAARGAGIRVSLTVRRLAAIAARPLGRAELRAYRGDPWNGPGSTPGAELNHKLYRQATNKVAGISEAAAAFLHGFF